MMDGDLNTSSASSSIPNSSAATASLTTQSSIMDELQGLSLAGSVSSVGTNGPVVESSKSLASGSDQSDLWGDATPFVQAQAQAQTQTSNQVSSSNSSFATASASIPTAEIARRKSSKEDIMSLYDSNGAGFDASFGAAQQPSLLQPQMMQPQMMQPQSYQYGSYQYGSASGLAQGTNPLGNSMNSTNSPHSNTNANRGTGNRSNTANSSYYTF